MNVTNLKIICPHKTQFFGTKMQFLFPKGVLVTLLKADTVVR
jgi:hypothetical protein